VVPEIPNISVTTLPIASMKARYYMENGQDEKALIMLRAGIKANPYLGFSETLMSQIYSRQNKVDSAIFYAKMAYEHLPIPPHFTNYLNLLIKKNDSQEVDRIFVKDSAKHDVIVWKNYMIANNALKLAGTSQVVKVANKAIELFPIDKDFLILRKIAIIGKLAVDQALALSGEGAALFVQQDYFNAAQKFLAAAAIDPLEFSYFENAGTAYFSMGQYEQSLPYFNTVIEKLNPKSGKSEYIMGLSLVNLGRMEEACEAFRASKAYMNSEAEQALALHCKE
jgi:tetratricopeptide (TPR) repeat protein